MTDAWMRRHLKRSTASMSTVFDLSYSRRGFAYDEINAVIATDSDNPANVLMRLEALHEVRESPDLLAIAAAFKRIKNILKQAGNGTGWNHRPQGNGTRRNGVGRSSG